MADNLLDMAVRQLGTSGIDALRGALGLPEDQGEAAVNTGVSSVLAGMLNKGESKTGLTSMFNRVTESTGLDLSALPDILRDSSQMGSLLETGGNMADSIFGSKAGDVGGVLGSSLGVGGDKGSSLLKIAAPIVMSLMGKLVKGKGLDVGGLAGLLFAQKSHIKGHLPDGLLKTIGVHDFEDLGQHLESHGHAEPQTSRPHHKKVEKKRGGFAKWFWPLLIALAVLYTLNMCSKKEQMEESPGEGVLDEEIITEEPDTSGQPEDQPDTTPPGAAPQQDGDQAGTMGAAADEDLGSSMEQYLGNSSRDPNREFRLRIEFQQDSAEVTSASAPDVQALATILTKNPELTIAIEGHTSSDGDENRNKALSQQRADAVKQMLVEKGIDESRITSMGMGSAKPLADNATEAGKQQNRRISVRVVKFE
ncbi:OmpA family protein [Microbulbifer sp. YPW16]|uniref:OmpA family protein n=1 Tax=Microbulbifer sp. YPW16 TaxID=2904242 RepID=UPI001E44E507|nr:OmpA family protein [Microbulbifer sp. YPW16]UHQ56990.1 OmpA family protein [Microbulbifer sp. YPW16]